MQEIVGKHVTQSCFPVGKGLVLCNRSGGRDVGINLTVPA